MSAAMAGPEPDRMTGARGRAGVSTQETPMAFICTIPATPTVQQDDETIRITRWDFEPGAVTGWHEHGWPYFVVMLVAGTLRIHNGTDVSDVPLAQGQAYMRPAGIRHDVMNGSDHPIAFVEIEVKQPGALKELSLP
jgi:quercetin dioxygenase-like cupin family protein